MKYVDLDGRENRTSQNLRKDYLKTQKMLIGAKYVYGAENPLNLEKDKNGKMKEGGVDYSGAPQFGLRLMGYLIPERVNANQFVENYTEQVELSTCEPGDLRAMRMDDNYVYHLQTVTENGRINPTGDSSNTYDNPGEVEEFIGELPSSGTIQRLSADLLSQYYNSSADIVGGKLNPSQLDKAWENICKWSN